MGPWDQTHLHQFEVLPDNHRNVFTERGEVLKIAPLNELEELDPPKQAEETLLLSDVYGPQGRFRHLILRDGVFLPLIYLYDFGVRTFFTSNCHIHNMISRTTGTISLFSKAPNLLALVDQFSVPLLVCSSSTLCLRILREYP